MLAFVSRVPSAAAKSVRFPSSCFTVSFTHEVLHVHPSSKPSTPENDRLAILSHHFVAVDFQNSGRHGVGVRTRIQCTAHCAASHLLNGTRLAIALFSGALCHDSCTWQIVELPKSGKAPPKTVRIQAEVVTEVLIARDYSIILRSDTDIPAVND